GLRLAGEHGTFPGSGVATCMSTIVNPATLEFGPVRDASCDDPTLYGTTIGVTATWPRNTDPVTLRVVRADPRTGHISRGPVVMTYTHYSDSYEVTATAGAWFWVYDVAA